MVSPGQESAAASARLPPGGTSMVCEPDGTLMVADLLDDWKAWSNTVILTCSVVHAWTLIDDPAGKKSSLLPLIVQLTWVMPSSSVDVSVKVTTSPRCGFAGLYVKLATGGWLAPTLNVLVCVEGGW